MTRSADPPAAAGTARNVLITGCSSGIGLDAARTLSARGWQVWAGCRQQADCDRLAEAGLRTVLLDYEAPETLTAALDRVLAEDGRLDALFNNGAYAIPAPLEDVPAAALRAIFEANLIGWHDLTRQVIGAMRAQGGGRIVMCSSVLGFVGAPWRGAYVATKHALEGYSDVLRMELADTPIRVSVIQPGPIRTRFRANAVLQFERWIDWQTSARAQQYRDGLLDQLYKGSGDSRFTLPPAAVTDRLIHALESPRPRARYRVTVPTRAMAAARRLLPGSMLDRILSRA